MGFGAHEENVLEIEPVGLDTPGIRTGGNQEPVIGVHLAVDGNGAVSTSTAETRFPSTGVIFKSS